MTFNETLINIGIFVAFLMVAGSLYGLVYSSVLYIRDFEKANREMRRFAKVLGIRYWVFGICVVLLGFFNWVFFILGAFVLLSMGLYVFAKGLEVVSMVKVVSGKELREGDWLVEEVRVKGKVIEADWDGLSLDDIELLKGRKKVKIKEGLPFVPAFLIAFLGYVFLRGWVLGLVKVF